MTQRKALALISGGLDSLLATRVIQEQGIHVEGVNFFTGFCVEGHTHAIRQKDKDKPKRNNALWSAERLGIKMVTSNAMMATTTSSSTRVKPVGPGHDAALPPTDECPRIARSP